MEHHSHLQCVLFQRGLRSLFFRRVRDDAVTAEVSLGHALISGTCQGRMIVTGGRDPDSVVFVNDRSKPKEQQMIVMTSGVQAVDLSPTLDTAAVMLDDGSPHCLCSSVAHILIDRYSAYPEAA